MNRNRSAGSIDNARSAIHGAPQGDARRPPGFRLLFVVMLVIAAGNTGLQSVLPGIGRQLGLPDTLIAIAFSFSALLWALSAPFWARRSDRSGRKAMILIGMIGYVVSLLLCAVALSAGIAGWIGAGLAFAGFVFGRMVYGLFGSAAPPAAQALVAGRTSRAERTAALTLLASAFGLGTILGPALAPFFVMPVVGLAGPAYVFAAIGIVVTMIVLRRLPDEHGPGHGAAVSEPALGGAASGEMVADRPDDGAAPLSLRDPRIWPWLVAGLIAGHAQAATVQTIAFLVIDRLALAPALAQPIIGLVFMTGAGAALIAQWGVIPRFDITPRRLVIWGSVIAALGLLALALASDMHALAVAFALSSLGFGLLRPGFTAGASLAVGRAEQAAVAGHLTSINGFVFVLGPAAGILLYEAWRPLPYLLSAALLALLPLYALKHLKAGADEA